MSMRNLYSYINENSEKFLQELVSLVKHPSISARKEGVQECADIVEKLLLKTGFSTKVIPEKNGNPVIYGELKSSDSEKTIMFYDHYDVQPAEPLDEWDFGAFSGKIHEGRIYGRGSSDNKGNIVSRVKAVEAFLKETGGVPVNIKFVVEGEEEIGSPHFAPVVKKYKELFANDGTIWEFGGTNYQGQPEIYLGLKGVLSIELKAKGASQDVHSAYAPLVPNPAWHLIWALCSLKNPDDKILIEGFYDEVESISKQDLELLRKIPSEEKKLKKTLGLTQFLHHSTGVEAKKALLYSPTCTINGFLTGYTGKGSKTVLPKDATVKIDFRLVPNQMPKEILTKLISHLKKGGFEDIEIIRQGSTEPARTPVNERLVQVVVDAARKIYKKKVVVYPTSSASGPMHLFRNWLGCPVVSAGCSHANSKTHAPNENLTIDGFIKGTKLMATIINDFA